jgi:hypothetical protein
MMRVAAVHPGQCPFECAGVHGWYDEEKKRETYLVLFVLIFILLIVVIFVGGSGTRAERPYNACTHGIERFTPRAWLRSRLLGGVRVCATSILIRFFTLDPCTSFMFVIKFFVVIIFMLLALLHRCVTYNHLLNFFLFFLFLARYDGAMYTANQYGTV